MRLVHLAAAQAACLAATLFALHMQSQQVGDLSLRLTRLHAEQRSTMRALEARLAETGPATPVAAHRMHEAPSFPPIARTNAHEDLLDAVRELDATVATCRVGEQPPATVAAADAPAREAGTAGASDTEIAWLRQQAWAIVDEALAMGQWGEPDREALGPIVRQLPAREFDQVMLRLHDAMNRGEIAPSDVDLL